MKDSKVYFISDQPARLSDQCVAKLVLAEIEVEICASVSRLKDLYHPGTASCILAYMCASDYLGIDIHRTIVNHAIGAPVILLSEAADVPMAVTAIKQGAFDVLPWPSEANELRDTINQAIASDQKRLKRQKMRDDLKNRLDDLTPREKEILQMVVNGLSSSQIAYKLVRSEKTVKLHRAHIMKKLACDSAHELVHRMIKLEFNLDNLENI